MILIPPGVRILLATRPVDFRKGMDSLAALVQQPLELVGLGAARDHAFEHVGQPTPRTRPRSVVLYLKNLGF